MATKVRVSRKRVCHYVAEAFAFNGNEGFLIPGLYLDVEDPKVREMFISKPGEPLDKFVTNLGVGGEFDITLGTLTPADTRSPLQRAMEEYAEWQQTRMG